MMESLREGYTTGSCAAAAVKGAVMMLLRQQLVETAEITLPGGRRVSFPVNNGSYSENQASCYVSKDAGDDPDITNGIELWAKVTKHSNHHIIITGGKGIGAVTKPGLPVAVGEPAINPIPRQMILREVEEVLENREIGLMIEVSIPNGEELAQKTLNSHLGIKGGLSILGTTGIVKPMSEEAYKKSLIPQLHVTYSLGYRIVVLTPGNIGHKSAVKYGVPEEIICQTSNFVGYILEEAEKTGFTEIILWGHPGKLLKIAGGNFQTHNRISDGRMETLAAYLAVLEAPVELIKLVLAANTTEQAMEHVRKYQYQHVWEIIARKVSERTARYLFNKVKVGTVLLANRDEILTADTNAKIFWEELKWRPLQ
ncbi:MAG: cobalt-precorrin-5B (C(1))-methyltransferase CbiD [Peptococcaceae bacterium]